MSHSVQLYTWAENELPNLLTAYNSTKLACENLTILLLMWGKFANDRQPPEILGHARIKLTDLLQFQDGDVAYSFSQDDNLCKANINVGRVISKCKFSVINLNQ